MPSADERRRGMPVTIPELRLTRTAVSQRSSTTGPLETDVKNSKHPPSASTSSQAQSSPSTTLSELPPRDLGFLRDPSNYHAFPTANIPPQFVHSPKSPPTTTPLEKLLDTGHYRLAAVSAAHALAVAPPTDTMRLFHLLYTRLACLCLIDEAGLAAQESKLLGDLDSAFYRHPLSAAHLMPWELRVLVTRLAPQAYGEWRKAVMGFYELAREARAGAASAASEADKQLWRTRLRECGIRVANVLVEMDDFEGAGRHLSTLSPSPASSEEDREILVMETLVWLRIGDVRTARQRLSLLTSCFPSPAPPPDYPALLSALLQIAESSYPAAVSTLESLSSAHPTDSMLAQNLALCKLYTGNVLESRAALTRLVDSGHTPLFPALLFNLCTLCELCSERSRELKVALAERLASRESEPSQVGWEVSNAVLKL